MLFDDRIFGSHCALAGVMRTPAGGNTSSDADDRMVM
jgi:hypothetical protein